jgi:hypothetical protein
MIEGTVPPRKEEIDMATRAEKETASANLRKKLEKNRARSKEAEEALAEARNGGNGTSAPATPAETKTAAPAKKRGGAATSKPSKSTKGGKKTPTKKATNKGKASKPTKGAKSASAPKQAPARRTNKKPKVTVKKDKPPKIVPGLASIASSRQKDEATGLTLFQLALVKIVKKGGDAGMPISTLIRYIWTDDEISKAKKEQKNSAGTALDLKRIVRNAIRVPRERGFIRNEKGTDFFVSLNPDSKS